MYSLNGSFIKADYDTTRQAYCVSLAEVDDACNVYYCVLTLHELNFIYCWHSCKAP